MTTVRLAEHEALVVDLTPALAAALDASAAVRVTPTGVPGQWLVKATKYVGVVTVGDVTLAVRPKVPVARLLFMLGYADDPAAWRDDPVGLDEGTDLWSAMAELFVRQAEQALRRGVLQGYHPVDASMHGVRGRIRESDQLRLRPGLVVPVEVRFDEYDVDVPENRILRAAAERLLRIPSLPPATTRRLRHLTVRLSVARRLVAGEPLPPTPATRLNSRYRPALALARLVLAGRSVDTTTGSRRATGFLFDMNAVFERFVTRAFTEALHPYGNRCVQQQDDRLDEARRLRMRPDLVRYAPAAASVLDAKYKTDDPIADAYQVLAYCVALDVRRGDLVYATRRAAPVRHVVRHSAVTIVEHGLDLALPATALLEQVAGIARDIMTVPDGVVLSGR